MTRDPSNCFFIKQQTQIIRPWPILMIVVSLDWKLCWTNTTCLSEGEARIIALLWAFHDAPTQKKTCRLCFSEGLTSQWDDNESAPRANVLGKQRHRYVTNSKRDAGPALCRPVLLLARTAASDMLPNVHNWFYIKQKSFQWYLML